MFVFTQHPVQRRQRHLMDDLATAPVPDCPPALHNAGFGFLKGCVAGGRVGQAIHPRDQMFGI